MYTPFPTLEIDPQVLRLLTMYPRRV